MSQNTSLLNKYTFCYIIAIGGLLFGFDTAVISGTLELVVSQFGLTALQEGNYVGAGLYGCILGVLLSGVLTDKAGRKKSAIFSALLYAVSAVGCAYVSSFTWLCGYRLLGGIAVGITSTLAPLYISEIAPAAKRGRLVSIYQLLLTAGILMAYASNSMVISVFETASPQSLFEREVWRPMYLALAIPSVIYFILILLIPESPTWLVNNGMKQRAQEISSRYAIEFNTVVAQKIPMSVLFKKSNIKSLLIGVLIPFLGQFSGINAVIYYGPRILSTVGLGSNALLIQILFGGVNLLTTFIAVKYVDKLGRKPLLTYGLIGIITSLLSLAFLSNTNLHWLVIVFIFLFIACYAFSLGPVQWVVISELFPASIRGRAVSICTFSLWIAATLIGNFFPVLLDAYGITFCFVFFAALSAVLLVIIRKVLSEYKGKSLEEVEESWKSSGQAINN